MLLVEKFGSARVDGGQVQPGGAAAAEQDHRLSSTTARGRHHEAQTLSCIRPVPDQRHVVLAAQQPMQSFLMIGAAVQHEPGVLRLFEQLLDYGAVVWIRLDQQDTDGCVARLAA